MLEHHTVEKMNVLNQLNVVQSVINWSNCNERNPKNPSKIYVHQIQSNDLLYTRNTNVYNMYTVKIKN